ncbi:hypothetical protein Tco_0785438 [Tanacetum coccineum]
MSAFMHGHGHLELTKKLNDKIPKTMYKMFKRVRAFIRGEVAAGSAEMVRPSQGDKGYVRPAWSGVPKKSRNKGGPKEAQRNIGVYTPYPRKDTFTPLIKTPKEILAIESVSFPEPPPFIGTPEKQKLRKLCDYHGDRILVDGGSSSETMYEHCFRNLDINIQSSLRRCKTPMIGFSGETYNPQGVTDLRVTMGKEGRSKTVLMEFAIIKCHSPYNIIIRRTKMRSLGTIVCNDGNRVDNQWQAVIGRHSTGKHRGVCMNRIRKDSCSTIRHETSNKDIPPHRTSGSEETTHDTRRKASVEKEGVMLAKRRTNKKIPTPRMDRQCDVDSVSKWNLEGASRLLWP